MTLNKAQQQEWAILQSVLQATRRVCPDVGTVKEEMKLWIADFESFVNHDYKVKIISSPELSLKLVDCSRDSMKVSVDATPSVTLRARNESVQIKIKAAYRDSYAFTNSEIAESLRTLAEKLDRLDTEIREISEDSDLTPSVDKTVSVADEAVEGEIAEDNGESLSEVSADGQAEAARSEEQLSSDSDNDPLNAEFGEVLLVLEPAPEEE